MTEPTNDIPITYTIRESYPLIIGKLNNYQSQIDEIELTPGDSAYTVALNNGFEGSEEEWLASLEGDPGQQGDAGEGVPTGGATGQVLAKNTATDYDTSWKDDAGLTQAQADKLERLGKSASLIRNTPQSIPNTTWTAVSWDGVVSDPEGWRSSGTPSRFYPGAGIYIVTLYSVWANNTTGVRQLRVDSVVGGSSSPQQIFVDPAKRPNAVNTFSVQSLLADSNDYIVAEVWQDTGGALDFRETSKLFITRIG